MCDEIVMWPTKIVMWPTKNCLASPAFEDIKSKQTKKALQSLPLRASRNTRDTGHVYHVTASKYNAAQSRDRPRGMTSLQKICSENGRDCKALLALLLRKSAASCARVEGLI